MREIIGMKLLLSKETKPARKPLEIYDTRLPGFTLRIQPSGVRSYYARLGRSGQIALGRLGVNPLLPTGPKKRGGLHYKWSRLQTVAFVKLWQYTGASVHPTVMLFAEVHESITRTHSVQSRPDVRQEEEIRANFIA